MAATSSPDTAAAATGAFRLTAINDSGDRVVAEPEGMSRVRELNGQLGDVVKTLNSKVSRVLHKQEAEFLSAYRGHMYSVQKELQSWKDKADAARLRHERDQRMQRLTEECAWFRKEALRLNKFNTGLKRDVQLLREKLNAVEEDRDWLDRQLKAAKKDNKLLRAELELRMTEPSAADSAPAHESRGGEWSARGHGFNAAVSGDGVEHDSLLPPLQAAVPSSSSSSPLDAVPGRTPASAPGVSATSASPGRGSATSAVQLAKLEARLAKQTAQLNAERAKSKRLRQAAASDGGKRRNLQRLLEQCVSEVRSETRKLRGSGGAAGPSADGLNAGGRRLVVQRLLEDDLVLEALHRTIFGRGDRPTSAEGDGTSGDPGEHYDDAHMPAGASEDAGAEDEGFAGGSVRFAAPEETKSAAGSRRGVIKTRLGAAGGLSLAQGAAPWEANGVPGTSA